MKRLVLLSWLLVTLINFDIVSQSKAEDKNNFLYAESRILYEDYKEALPQYQQLLRGYPDNANFKYRIGQCYLFTPGEKEKAIRYLEEAVKNINPQYSKGKFTETGAPYDALYLLANAYRINNQLDKAIEIYRTLEKNINSEIYDTALVDHEIQSCLNAKELLNRPIYLKMTNIGNNVNYNNTEFNPVVSDKEDLIVFSRSQPFYDAILFSKKTNGVWSAPVNINEQTKVDRDLYPTSLSADGKLLYLYSSAEYDGNIYSSQFENGSWSPIVKLNGNINTKYWESHAAISHDNKKLYFTSNRKGTLGGLDIYVSSRDSIGDWGPAVNLGSVINSKYNEESPFLSKDDKTLYFSSRGHFNMGGYDIFYSTLMDNGEWSVPMNVGYPLNTTDDDVFYKPVNEGYEGYIARESTGGFGKQDIYRVERFSADHPRKFFVKGVVSTANLQNRLKDSVKISIVNIQKTNQKQVLFSDPSTGDFKAELPQGSYTITYENEGSEKMVRNFNIPPGYPSDIFELPSAILSKSEITADAGLQNEKITPSLNEKPTPVPQNVSSRPVSSGIPGRISSDKAITDDRIAALIASLRSRAKGIMVMLVADADLENHISGNPDSVISRLKEEASRKNINTEEVDKLALKSALYDNILTQSAVDLLARYADEDLKKILTELDIYRTNLKTWTDLEEYISEKSGGTITREQLNLLAVDIITVEDPSISVLREKILAFSEKYTKGEIIRQSVSAVDSRNIKITEKWFLALYNESVKQGLTIGDVSDMLVIISSLPDTRTGQYLNNLTEVSDEPLRHFLQDIDLKKEKLKSPRDLTIFLLSNSDKEKYTGEALFKAFAKLVISKNIPAEIIASQPVQGKNQKLWILWVVAGAFLVLFLIIFRKKRRTKEN